MNGMKNFTGNCKAVVVDVDRDACKVQVCIPSIHGKPLDKDKSKYPWASMCTLNLLDKSNKGFMMRIFSQENKVPILFPNKGDVVYVTFEGGDIRNPIFIGNLGKDSKDKFDAIPQEEEGGFWSEIRESWNSKISQAITPVIESMASEIAAMFASSSSSGFVNDGTYPLGSVCYAFETGGQVLGSRNCWMNETLADGAGQNYGMMSTNRGSAEDMIEYIKNNSENFRTQIGSKKIFTSEFNAWWKGSHSTEDTSEMESLQAQWCWSTYGMSGCSGQWEFLSRSRALKEMVIARSVHQGAASKCPGSKYMWTTVGISPNMSDEEIISKVYQWLRHNITYGIYTESIRTNRIPKEEEMVKSFLTYQENASSIIAISDGEISEIGSKIAEVAQNSSKYGVSAIGYRCQAWVSDVYNVATGKRSSRACCANHAGNKWGASKDWSKIQVGAAVYGYASSRVPEGYGHVGIYIGNGMVCHNIGGVKKESLNEWISKYEGIVWGWENGDVLNSKYPCKPGLMTLRCKG